MRIDYPKAKKLCSPTEFELLEEAKPKNLTSFSAAELRKRISRSRKLSDKWRDQARSQGNSTDGSAARSQEKHVLFQEAVERFEARLDRVTAPPPAKKAATKASPPMPKIPVPPKVSRKSKMPGLAKQAERKAIATKLRIETSGLKSRIRGHVSARGRRAQAARESRN
jgi:hypothetical protein